MADEVKNILTKEEAARVVGVDPSDERLSDILPQVDSFIKQSTGRDWTQDSPIKTEAKEAARLRLALTYDLMSMQQNQIDALQRALDCALMQLEFYVDDTDLTGTTSTGV